MMESGCARWTLYPSRAYTGIWMWLLGVVVVIGGLGVPAWAAPATLDRIEVGSRGTVTLHLSSPAEARAVALGPSGEAPDRIYVDLRGVSLGHAAPTVVPGAGNVVRVRSGQFDTDTTRVVLDLGHAEPFAVRARGSTVTVEVGSAYLAPPRTFARDRAPPPPVAVASSPPVSPPPPPGELEGPPLPPRPASRPPAAAK